MGKIKKNEPEMLPEVQSNMSKVNLDYVSRHRIECISELPDKVFQ